jgi:aspartyl-tRNA(Asn)/glutamyl-tRNA(Gln) amidotransferase subunit C
VKESIAHLAELASLTLVEGEAESLATDLEKIVAYVNELQSIDVEGIAPTTSMGGDGAIRADVPIAGLSHEEALAGAPKVEADGFAVPTFVEQ